MTLALLAVAGAVGAAVRSLAAAWLPPTDDGLPRATLAVNLVGSLLLGFLWGGVAGQGWPLDARLVLGTGFCGGLTTFSTLAADVAELRATGRRRAAATSVAANVVGGLAAAAVGLVLASR